MWFPLVRIYVRVSEELLTIRTSIHHHGSQWRICNESAGRLVVYGYLYDMWKQFLYYTMWFFGIIILYIAFSWYFMVLFTLVFAYSSFFGLWAAFHIQFGIFAIARYVNILLDVPISWSLLFMPRRLCIDYAAKKRLGVIFQCISSYI